VKTLQEFICESSLSRVWQHFKNDDRTVVILTSSRDGMLADDVIKGNKYIASKLQNAGFGYFFVEGHFIENKGDDDEAKVKEESVFAIADKNKSQNLISLTHKLANRYNQDAIIVKEGKGNSSVSYFLNKDNTKTALKGKLSPGKIGDYYTRLHNNKKSNTFVFEYVKPAKSWIGKAEEFTRGSHENIK